MNYQARNNYNGYRRLSPKKVAIAITLFVALIFAIIYLMFAVFFQSHFFFGTKINGVDVSGKSITAAQGLLVSDARYFVFKIIERDNVVEHISAENINMQLVITESVESVKAKQNAFKWLFAKDTEYTIDTSLQYSEDMLINTIYNLDCMDEDNMRKPTPVSLNYVDEIFVVKKGDPGTEIDKNKVKTMIIEAIASGKTELNLETSGCYLVEKGNDDSDYAVLTDTLNKYLYSEINLVFGDKIETINHDLICNWIDIDSDCNIIFNEEGILKYLNTLATKYETFGSNRTFTNSYGKTVIVKGGDYGWWFDRTTEIQNIINDIKKTGSTTRPMAYRQEAAAHGTIDIGNTYCEISLSKQKLFLYNNGELVLQTDIISGTNNTKYETPTGTYKLRYKQKNYTFKKSYFTRTVDFWMVFYGNDIESNIGIVSCDWLDKFGGNVYKIKGSYGSIYVKPEDAVTINKYLPNDSAIIIYE